ncbi:MAG: acyl-CoA dehydrogenase N-terminal domain-containing protein, partial [Variovorax paradoxus]
MTYQIPMRDIQFVLHELLQVPAMLQDCGQPDL